VGFQVSYLLLLIVKYVIIILLDKQYLIMPCAVLIHQSGLFNCKYMPKGIKGFQKGHKINVNRKTSEETKQKMRKSRKDKYGKNKWLNEKSPAWKGENAKYTAIHMWVNSYKGKPQVCIDCGATCKERKLCWSNIDHKYRRVLDDYQSRCYSCHKIYDLKMI